MSSSTNEWSGSIERVGWGGLGLGRTADGRLVLLSAPLALFPGELVEAQLTEHARHFTGEVQTWGEHDPRRVAPACRVALDCGGCSLWGAGTATGELKQLMVADLFARQLPGAPEWDWHSAPPAAQRQRIQLHWDGQALGFHSRGSHCLVPVSACPMAVEPVQAAIPALTQALAGGALPGAPARWELATGTPPGTVIASCAQLPGEAWVWEAGTWRAPAPRLKHAVAGVELVQSPGAFFQACAAWAVEAFAALLTGWDFSGEHLYDLYGGGGLFSRLLARRFTHYTLVENSPLAVSDAKLNLTGLDVCIVEQPVERWLKPGLGTPRDTIILDPPRAGLGRKLCEVLRQAQAGHIVLCGCDGAAFCRDVGLLAPRWRLHRLAVLDLFPNTSQVECVGELLPAE